MKGRTWKSCTGGCQRGGLREVVVDEGRKGRRVVCGGDESRFKEGLVRKQYGSCKFCIVMYVLRDHYKWVYQANGNLEIIQPLLNNWMFALIGQSATFGCTKECGSDRSRDCI